MRIDWVIPVFFYLLGCNINVELDLMSLLHAFFVTAFNDFQCSAVSSLRKNTNVLYIFMIEGISPRFFFLIEGILCKIWVPTLAHLIYAVFVTVFNDFQGSAVCAPSVVLFSPLLMWHCQVFD